MIEVKQEKTEAPKTPKVKKDSKIKPKKLRPLVQNEKTKTNDEIDKKSPKNYRAILAVLLGVILSCVFSNISYSQCGFWATYENNFNKIVHGDERFCYRALDPTEIYDELVANVVAQDDAIRLIKGSLNIANREQIIQMAFYGSTGTGKTLASNLIMRNFKWQRNIINTIFDLNFKLNLTGQEAFDSDLEAVKTKFSECGFNLLVIDDVEPKLSVIQRINRLERSLHRMVKQKFFKLIMIVIFNGEIKTDNMKNFVTIEFESFTKATFKQCIDLHLKLRNVQLKESEIEELKMINFKSSGCKTVAKKINLIANL